MARPSLSREEFQTPEGRKKAWRELMIGDHGALRLLYDNTHEIAPGRMWRSYQPSPAMLARWKTRGVRTVINLRGDKPSGHFFLEEEACRKLGMRLVVFRLFSRDAPSKEALHGARALFAEIEYPALIHCKSGADRAGLMAALFLFMHEGKPLDEALRQLSFRYGHIRQGKTGVIDYVFDKYRAFASERQLDLADVDAFMRWVDDVYDPAAAKAEFMGTWWGNLLTDKVLRRE